MPYQPILATLGYLLSPDRRRVLMVHRNARPGDQHLGKYNGLGGKLEADEDVASGMRREIMEEAGVECLALELRGTISWPGFGKQGEDWLGFLFLVTAVCALIGMWVKVVGPTGGEKTHLQERADRGRSGRTLERRCGGAASALVDSGDEHPDFPCGPQPHVFQPLVAEDVEVVDHLVQHDRAPHVSLRGPAAARWAGDRTGRGPSHRRVSE